MPARSLMFRCSALNVMLCAFTTLIVGHVRGLFLAVGPVSTAVSRMLRFTFIFDVVRYDKVARDRETVHMIITRA